MYIFEDGEIKRDNDGNPIKNPAPPDCSKTPCKSRELKPVLYTENEEIYRKWELCQYSGHLPKAGGVDDQDPFDMEMFRIIWKIEDEYRQKEKLNLIEKFGTLAFVDM